MPGSFDSLIAKLVVTGRDRTQALERSRRALAEFVVDGMPTVIPFHRVVVDDPAFVGDGDAFGVYTSWIETEFDNQIPPYAGASPRRSSPASGRPSPSRSAAGASRSCCPAGFAAGAAAAGGQKKPKREQEEGRRRGQRRLGHLADAGHHREGVGRGGPGGRRGRRDRGARGDEDGAADQGPQGRHRHRAEAEVGATVTSGAVICELKDA